MPRGVGHLKSLAVNVVIAASKGVAAFLTGSGAMLAETLHSFADCGNPQQQLLQCVRATRRPPDRAHPLGYGRAMYFHSFIVALLLFLRRRVFSIYEVADPARLRSFEELAELDPNVERVLNVLTLQHAPERSSSRPSSVSAPAWTPTRWSTRSTHSSARSRRGSPRSGGVSSSRTTPTRQDRVR